MNDPLASTPLLERHPTGMIRGTAACVALVALAGLSLNFLALFESAPTAVSAVWTLLRYFTITTNLMVAVLFIAIAVAGRASLAPKWMGCAVLSIVLVGVVYAVLLSGLYQFMGGMYVADVLLHRVTPILVPLFWLALVPKGNFRWHDPLIWALYPLGYFAYAMIRGEADGQYAYPFINVAELGWGQTAFNAVAIAVGYFLVGSAFIWLDRKLDR